MKKIGLLLRVEPNAGGAYQYSKAIIDALAALPHDKFSIIVGYTFKSWLKLLDTYDLEKIYIPTGFWGKTSGKVLSLLVSPVRIWRKICPYFHPVAKALLREHCDLWIFPSQDMWSYQIPVPALVSVYDLMHRYERRFPEVSTRGEYRRRELHYRNICRWAKAILVDSELGKQHVMDSYGVTSERIFVLPYVAPAHINNAQQNKEKHFDSRYNLPAKFIFYPAQFWKHKNHERLVSAVGLLKKDIPDIKLVLVGSKKNNYESTRKLVRNLNLVDDVIFLGFVPDEDMSGMYMRARALVMPTFFGPTNIPPLEAFAAGCPVAVSGIYAMHEQVGNAALLFNPESIDEISECIRRLWLDDKLCSELAARGKQRVAYYQQKNFNDRLVKIIDKILT